MKRLLVVLGCLIGAGLALVLLEAVTPLVFGWLLFVARVVPQVTAEPVTITTGCIALVLFVASVQMLGRWSYRPASTTVPAAWPWRWTMAVVALTALLFVSGLSAYGLLRSVRWLLAST